MNEKEILKQWGKVTDAYNIMLANLQTYMENESISTPKDILIKHYNEVSKELNKLQTEANKLMAAYYSINFNKVIANNSSKSSISR